MRKPRVLISVPTLGWLHTTVAQSLLLIDRDDRIEKQFVFPVFKPYEASLHMAIRHMLEGGFDYWLTFDDDNAPKRNPLDLVWLDLDVIACPTPVWIDKGNNVPFHLAAMDQFGDSFRPHVGDSEGLQEVDAAGSGCMLIARRVLEGVRAPFMRIWNKDGIPIRGCDYAFSVRVRDAGFRVWAHYDYPCHHVKDLDLDSVVPRCHDVFRRDDGRESSSKRTPMASV